MFTTVELESLPKDSGVENKGQRSVEATQNDKVFSGFVNNSNEKIESNKIDFNFLF